MSDRPITKLPGAMSSANYFAQLRQAIHEEQAYYQRLKEQGWIYHEETGHWSHPTVPGAEIWPG